MLIFLHGASNKIYVFDFSKTFYYGTPRIILIFSKDAIDASIVLTIDNILNRVAKKKNF